MAFGSYPIISLADARAAHAAARAELHRGIDPMAERKAEKSAELVSRRRASTENDLSTVENPFSEVAALWFEKWKQSKVERYARNTETRIQEDVVSRIGNRPIAAIKPAEIAKMILAIEERGAADVARRALQNTQQIFRYAMAFGLAEQNPGWITFCAARTADDGACLRAHGRVDSSPVGGVRSQRKAMEHTGGANEDEAPSFGSALAPGARRIGRTVGTPSEALSFHLGLAGAQK